MRILAVEDDPAVSRSLALMLRSDTCIVDTADLGEEGIELATVNTYGLILLDLNLPDLSGYEVLRALRVARVNTPIVIVSGLGATADKVRGLELGADDYLTKPFHKDELLARVQAVVRRSQGPTEEVVRCGDLVVRLDAQRAEVAGQPVPLTVKEYQMLELLVLRKGMTVSKDMFLSCPRFLWTPYCPEKLEDDSVEGDGKTMIDAAGLVGSEGERSSSMPSITGQATGAGPLAPGQRWSLARKHEVVLRLLRGEPVEAVSRQVGVPVWQLERWRARALAGLKTGLRERSEDPAERELAEAHRRIGELSMEVELLRARIERPGPLARRRSR